MSNFPPYNPAWFDPAVKEAVKKAYNKRFPKLRDFDVWWNSFENGSGVYRGLSEAFRDALVTALDIK